MRCAAILSLVLLAVVSGHSLAEDKMDGVWVPVSAELGDAKFPDAVLKSMKLTIKDGNYEVVVGNTVDKGTSKADDTKSPKQLDITGTDGPNKGKTYLAIYKVEGDKLIVCYDLGGTERPTEFVVKPKSTQFLVTYQREKK